MLTLKKEDFERSVPAFRDYEARTYNSILPYIEATMKRAFEELQPEPVMDSVINDLKDYIYLSAAWDALPHLDLTLTENGFAVVSNQHVAPASAERVERLREHLRQQKSRAKDAVIFGVLEKYPIAAQDNAGLIPPKHLLQRQRRNFLFCPTMLRRHGISTWNGRAVYEEEYMDLTDRIEAAQWQVEELVSPELTDRMLENQVRGERGHQPNNSEYIHLIELCRNLMAAIITSRRQSERELRKKTLAYLEAHIDKFSQYKNTPSYEANHFQPYENRKDDACFFFG